jgi:NAD(P)-dependent dehydrogenase (short-subunit alcohol dehydrogenase family)
VRRAQSSPIIAGDLIKSAAIKRFGRPAEIAAVIAFCASEAPGYLTGVDVLVDGARRLGTSSAREPRSPSRVGG